MITNDTLFLSVAELAAQIRARKLSPVELTEAYLQRLETVGKRLNAVAYVMRETALREAREAEDEIKRGRYLGPLHGIPYGVKDLLDTKDIPTTYGAEPFRNRIPPADKDCGGAEGESRQRQNGCPAHATPVAS